VDFSQIGGTLTAFWPQFFGKIEIDLVTDERLCSNAPSTVLRHSLHH